MVRIQYFLPNLVSLSSDIITSCSLKFHYLVTHTLNVLLGLVRSSFQFVLQSSRIVLLSSLLIFFQYPSSPILPITSCVFQWLSSCPHDFPHYITHRCTIINLYRTKMGHDNPKDDVMPLITNHHIKSLKLHPTSFRRPFRVRINSVN